MKGTILTIAALLFIGSSTLSAQKTVYLDNHFRWITDKEKAVEYAVITRESKKQTKVEFYTLDGRLKGIGRYSAYTEEPKERVRNGVCTFLYANGRDSLVSIFKENRLEGQSLIYYPEGATKLVTTYKEGIMDGKLMQYYPDGKVRREESYTNNECVGGKLLDADGKELEFEPYMVSAEFPGGSEVLKQLLEKKIKYPVDAERARIQGRVIIRFIIDKKGNMITPRIIRPVYPSLDKEALRVVEDIALKYHWTPTKVDGEFKRTSFTIPVMFRLP